MLNNIQQFFIIPIVFLLIFTISCNETNTTPTPTATPFNDNVPPEEVSELQGTEGNRSIILTWQDPTNTDFQKVEIIYSPQTKDPIYVNKGIKTYEIKNLYNCTEYTFTIKTIDIFNDKSIGQQILKTPRMDGIWIYLVIDSPTDSEQITIINCYDFQYDISNWILGDKNNSNAYTIPNNTFLNPCAVKTFPHTTLGFAINDSDEIIYLKNSSGITVDMWFN